jgi:tetratricopeptide (TPR) repeat protein
MIKVGMGIGEATHESGDYFGMPSIMAARLCDKAGGGQVLAPALVKLMAEERSDHAFSAVGELELKGLQKPVEAYEIAWETLESEEIALPLPARLVGVPPVGYVGRREETELLVTMWDKARSGDRQVGLIAGEPGIGKTRLATHTAIERHSDGATVLYGRCQEDLATPYGPWIEALAHFVEHAPQEVLQAHVERHGGELTRLLPGLDRRVEDAPRPKETDAETERYLLFEAMVGLLTEATAAHPVILLLDDLHWADKPTLALLKHLVGGSASLSLLVLGTYRDSELTRQHPLTAVLADLRAEQGVERISLDGLPEPDVVAIMEAAAGHEMDKLGLGLAHEIAEETSGNPFFVTEMLRNLIESGALVQGSGGRWELRGELSELGLPQSVREVIGHRVERLGDSVRRALTAAAVIGRDFDVEVLAGMVEQAEDELLDLLEEGVEASVLGEQADRPGSFSFAHALVNHTLYEDLGPTRRSRLHRRVAETLEELCGDDPGPRVTELAHHWTAATATVDPTKALDYSRRAGERALDELAPDEATRWFGQALSLHSQQSGADPRLRCDLLIGLGEAQRQTGDPDFRQTLLDASAIASELRDDDRLAQAAIANNRGLMSFAGVTDDEVIGALEEAIELTDANALERRATLLSLLTLELIWAGDLSRRLQLGEEALELARQSGDERTLAWVLWRRFNPTTVPETLDQRAEDMKELGAIAERLGDPVLRAFADLYGATQALESGDRARFEALVTTLNATVDELGQPVPRWGTRWLNTVREFLAGHLDEAERLAEEAAQVGADGGQSDAFIFYTGQLQQVRWAQDRVEELEDIFVQGVEDNPDLSPFRAILALNYCDAGRIEEARALLDGVAGGGFEAVPREMLWLFSMATWADVAGQTGHREAAAELYAKLEPWADQFPAISIMVWMPVAHYLGLLAASLGRGDDADRHFARALELEEAFEAPVFAAWTRCCWGRMLLESGDAERGQALVREALEAGRRLGIQRIERRAAGLLESAASSA